MSLNKRVFEDIHVLLPKMNWQEKRQIVQLVLDVLKISHMEEHELHVKILQAYPLMKVGQKLGFVELFQQVADRVEGEQV